MVTTLTRNASGTDLVPSKQSLSAEAIPKSVARVLFASHVREEWKAKKRKLGQDGDRSNGGKRRRIESDSEGKIRAQHARGKAKEKQLTEQLTIKPGESIQHFNRRVEDDMRPLVRSAMQTSNVVVRNSRRAEIETRVEKKRAKDHTEKGEEEKPLHRPASPPPAMDKHANRPKEFQKHSSSTPRRLNDVAQAPPEFKKLPRGATVNARLGSESAIGGRRDGVLSMAQKSMMDKERENAITRYRELKARWRSEQDDKDVRDNRG